MDCIITDTINQIAIKDLNYSQSIIWAILNSKLINWYVYYFIFSKAIRTMHFDNAVTDRIPIAHLNKSVVEQIESLVSQTLAAKKADPKTDTLKLEKQIDQLVYKLYDLTEEEITIIENRK